ncbi:hypothetical protein LPJ66_005667 [Kickxella alabastrina]|uniref:Uncharacterized protein n=1 Tax=Kickxella alabastrina TaxID=61397 RepID=A0ACC1IG90_9FUNG|nr:hypothetical protein LPJ66_005667 [Kickxella alabastrina]
MAADTQAGTKASPGGCTSQEWSLNDSTNFYTAMSAFTFFDDSKLVVSHGHFTDKEIEIINNVEFDNIINPPNVPYNSVDAESVWALTFQGVPMFGMSYVDMLSRLRTLQKATGGHKSAKVINQKHRDSIEKFAFEFKSLNETGGFTSAAHTGVSDSVNQQLARSLINIKNLDNIKALLRFITHGNMFCRANNVNMPLQELTTQMKEILADFSEPEMWIWAMVRRHGVVMISYMNTCISNLAATFVNEKSKLDAEDLRYMIAKNKIPKGYLAKLLKRMLDAIYDLEDDSEPKSEPKPDPNRVKPINVLPEPSNDASSTINDSNFSEILEILLSPQLTSISSNASFTYPTPPAHQFCARLLSQSERAEKAKNDIIVALGTFADLAALAALIAIDNRIHVYGNFDTEM